MQCRMNATKYLDILWMGKVMTNLCGWDGLYPAFLALSKFGFHKLPFRALAGIAPEAGRFMIEDPKKGP